MEITKLVQFWRDFFSGLVFGTIKKVILFAFLGLGLGLSLWWVLKHYALAGQEWSAWLLFLLSAFFFFWYGVFGTLHGIVLSLLLAGGSKISQMVEGVQDLFDHLSKGVIQRLPKFDKSIPKDQLEKKFDEMGREFLEKLRLKKGLTGLAGFLIFGLVLKSLKFFFLDDVVLRLKEKNAETLSSADIENAVRRVGVERLLEPVSDSILTFHFVNAIVMLFLLGLPFAIFFWL